MSIVVTSQTGTTFSPKDPAGVQFYGFDFTAWLASGEAVLSATVTASSEVDGSDSTLAMISGVATLVNSARVQQLVMGGQANVSYLLTCVALTSLGQTLPLSATLPVQTVFGVVA
jgi:hypothetical protein